MIEIKVAAIQNKKTSKEETFDRVEKLIQEAANANVDIACLSERWNLPGLEVANLKQFDRLDFKKYFEPQEGDTLQKLSEWAKENSIYLIGGAILENIGDKNYSVSPFFDRSGKLIGKQYKIHLYGIENRFLDRGNEFKFFKTEFGIISMAICFDFNAFPEVARYLAVNGADLVFNPSLIRREGLESWHIYLKARALENRLPVVGCNGIGKNGFGGVFTGECLIIDFQVGHESPAKLKIRQGKKSEEQIVIGDLNLEYARKIRKKRLSERIEFDHKIFKV